MSGGEKTGYTVQGAEVLTHDESFVSRRSGFLVNKLLTCQNYTCNQKVFSTSRVS